ncbi:hypothetical protein E2C01_093871 [Portunus trituberculatus]|uniref:Uncharacterized protein n=1 Tax=Portunus trituberculatus TaxID=210409 RepID=A0A5B7JZW7_PORTR|nr:hypothetical protein [Portunus trituberculatus]
MLPSLAHLYLVDALNITPSVAGDVSGGGGGCNSVPSSKSDGQSQGKPETILGWTGEQFQVDLELFW